MQEVSMRLNKSRKTETLRKINKYKVLYLLFITIFLYYAVLRYWPIFLAWIVAFKDLGIGEKIFDSDWVGFGNFITMFSDSEVKKVLLNTVQISLLRLGVGFVPPIMLAIMFHDMQSKYFKKVAQNIVYIPYFFSWVIIYGIAYAFLSEGHGFLNAMIRNMGFNGVDFFMNPKLFRPIIILSALWKEVGWGTIIYLAALSNVDPELYEAAMIDGAGPLRKIWNITVPSILPVVVFVLCISLGGLFYAGGEQILLFYNAAVIDKADIIDTWIYRVGLSSFQFGLATAVGLFQSFFGMILVLSSNFLAKKYTGNGIW